MVTFDAMKYKEIERAVYSKTVESYSKYGGVIFESMAFPLLEGANLKSGYKVLDVACGIGIPSLNAGKSVLPGGSVIGIDLAPGMVEFARKRASDMGLPNVEFREADAEKLPFSGLSFDVVLCHLGLIHFTYRLQALREMFRVLKKRGVLAVSVWSTLERTLVIGIVSKVVAELWPAAVIPGAPSWFDLGREGILERFLSDAGFKSIKVKRYDFPLKVGDSEGYWKTVLGVSGRLQMLLSNIPPDVAKEIEVRARTEAEKYRKGAFLLIPCEEVVAWAKKEA
jgi:ubiquinone/menaquinone biosynthesis C-methylase UbiE